ncbi:serine/threonine-protein kinase [Polyangium aurulentum]|uniref:serine/threonine-protein kinase n=1 Tax=Polyangium aurulentum TaxID=2567896 RepID=UPI0010AEC026|nr:serine/threonine-protein kinase [Polyangium aurulentum]UQA59507.1 serine/threonine protein kinase [Polyangium aurulentum]
MITIAEGQVVASKLRLERPLARGGMGSVWVAHHLKLDAPVAVKFMDPALAASDTARARFEREARASAQLQSPHVVQVHDYGVEDDTPYIVMELLRGEDLGQHLQKRGRIPITEAARILEPVCKALRRAHEVGLVHRDLKPGNVFLARHDEEETVKLLDFGIAKAVSPGTPQANNVTRSGNLVGSPLYMSPEQIRKSKEVDHRSDLWSLGVILYQMLTGRPPFVEDEVGAVLVAICTDPVPEPSSLVPDLGPEVDRFFARALARDPAHRFQNARELLDAFVTLAGMPRRGSLADASDNESAARLDAMLAETAAAPAPIRARDGAKDLPSVAIKPAEGATPSPPDGTFAASGRTQQETGEHGARHGARRALLAVALLSVVAVGWAINRASTEPLQAGDDGPGSPTLPLPPPTSEPVAVAPPPPPPPPPAQRSPEPEPEPEDDAKSAPTVHAKATDVTAARSDKPAAGDKRAPVRAPAPAATSGKAAGEVAQPGPADDAKELGL